MVLVSVHVHLRLLQRKWRGDGGLEVMVGWARGEVGDRVWEGGRWGVVASRACRGEGRGERRGENTGGGPCMQHENKTRVNYNESSQKVWFIFIVHYVRHITVHYN